MASARDKNGRKSKWDKPAPPGAAATEVAHEAARKLNAMLAAKGKLNINVAPPLLPPTTRSTAGPTKDSSAGPEVFTEEIDINDSPHRLVLCKGNVQFEISKYSGASVSTKGQYIPAAEKDNFPGQRPLYLFVQSSTKDQVNLAVHRIHGIMNGDDPFTAPPPVNNFQNPSLPSGMHFVQDKIFVGLDNVPPEFNLREKIVGPGESYFSHITRETGAKVQLRGRGSGFLEPTSGREAFEALYIYISHNTYPGLNAAKKLVENLIQTVSTAYQAFQMQQPPNNFYSSYGGQGLRPPHRPQVYMPHHHVQRYGPPPPPAHTGNVPSYPQYPHPPGQYPPRYHQPPQPRPGPYEFHRGNPQAPPPAFHPNQPPHFPEGPRPLMDAQFSRPPDANQTSIPTYYSPDHTVPPGAPHHNKVELEPPQESEHQNSMEGDKTRKRRFTEAKQLPVSEKPKENTEEPGANPPKRKFKEAPSTKQASHPNTTSNVASQKPAQRSVSSLDPPSGSLTSTSPTPTSSTSSKPSPESFRMPATPEGFTMPAPLRAPRAKQATTTLNDDVFPDSFKAPIARPPVSAAAKSLPSADDKKRKVEEPAQRKTTGIALLGNYDDSSDDEDT